MTYLLVTRSFLVSLLISVRSIYQTYQSNSFIPIPPNRECIESIDIVLHIPLAIDFFYDYLEKLSHKSNPDAMRYFALYIDLRWYDRVCQEEDSQIDEKREIARAIYYQYLEEESEFAINFDPNLLGVLQGKAKALDENLNEYLFIEVYAFVLDKLREYFIGFKNSQAFVELEDEIKRQEKLYEVLVDAEFINN